MKSVQSDIMSWETGVNGWITDKGMTEKLNVYITAIRHIIQHNFTHKFMCTLLHIHL